MSDEQIIYLGPEEELTDVRERLEKVQAEHIVLVVPQQTKLRSHVGWRLLHARSRELGKDVLVISSDRQVRGVVKAAGFKVADSLESPPSSKPRPGRPSRAGTASKSSPGSRGGTKGLTARKRAEQQRASRPPVRGGESAPAAAAPPTYPILRGQPEAPRAGDEGLVIEDLNTGGGLAPSGAPEKNLFGEPASRGPAYGSDYEFHIDTTPSVPPLLPREDEEEESDDPLLEDIRTAQRIRRAARENEPPAENAPASRLDRRAYDTAPMRQKPEEEEESEDPFSRIEDIRPSPLPEQRGAYIPMNEMDEEIPDISERPTDVLDAEVEDLGDQGDIVLPESRPSAPWSAPGVEEPHEEEDFAPLRPSASRRSGGLAPSLPRQDLEGEEDLPDIDNQPTRVIPPQQQRQPAARISGRLPGQSSRPLSQSRPLAPQQQRPRVSRPLAGAPVTQQRPPAGPRPQPRPAPASRSRRPGRGMAIALALIVILLIVLGALAYYGPSADVSLTLPAQNFSQSLSFSADALSKLDPGKHTLPAQVLVFTKSASGQGHASGTTKVGVVKAKGFVNFTNKDSRSLVIPTGTIVTTPNGVQFQTTAEPLIAPGATYPVQIEALNAGTSGNVAANTITIIQPQSLQKIGTSADKLTVTNPQPTSGGGVGQAAQVTAQDLDAIKKTLDPQLQQQFNAWLAQNVHNGDVQGTPVQKEQVSANPGPGQVSSSGSFTGTVTLQATVLVVRASDIQAAARAELNARASTKHAKQVNYALLAQKPISITKMKSSPAKDSKSISLSFTATGQIAPAISDQQIQQLLVSRSAQDAPGAVDSYLAATVGRLPDNARTSISITPSFFPWMPLIQDHIHVHRSTVLV